MSQKFNRALRLWRFTAIFFMALLFVFSAGITQAKQNEYHKIDGDKHHKQNKHKHNGKHGNLGTIVHIKKGIIEGAEDESNTWSWLGIPYAKPPVGRLRWKATKSPKPWSGVLETKEFCSECSQFDIDGNFLGSEDCLYLNVWRPATQERNLPVYVWIHGGGNSTGSASDDLVYGDKLAANANMVVVTINYRLGPMGWFIHESIEDDDPLNSSGNYGTLDIIKALKWVKKNIEYFGGDHRNVTIAGESAGGYNVMSLIISPSAKGLFHKAISQSGGVVVSSVDEGYLNADTAIDAIIEADPNAIPEDYDEPSELPALKNYLREKSAQDIFSAYPPGNGGMLSNFRYIFTDGIVIHSDGAAALDNPESYNQVPIILGSTKEEAKAFIFALYGKIPDPVYQSFAEMRSQVIRNAAVDSIAAAMSVHESQPDVYAFQLDYGAYNQDGFNAWPTEIESPPGSGVIKNLAIMFGAGHALDIPFFFNNWMYFGSIGPFTEENRPGFEALGEDVVKYLDFFTRTGKPHDPTGMDWLPWSNEEEEPKRILFDADGTDSIIDMSYE